jgi:Flp pilus assembly protein TadD
VTRRLAAALLALMATGCVAPGRSPPAPEPTSRSVQELAAAIAAAAQRSEHEPDARIRAQLAAQASRDGEACLAREPRAAACLYEDAVAQGLQARAHPTQAGGLLTMMLASLASAEALDPTYDQAGPARVRALVLIRAPGWPLGPGDVEAGVLAAQRAVALQPLFPPNLLALAEARAKSGDARGARESYQQARALAQQQPATPDRDDWLREADQALQHL